MYKRKFTFHFILKMKYSKIIDLSYLIKQIFLWLTILMSFVLISQGRTSNKWCKFVIQHMTMTSYIHGVWRNDNLHIKNGDDYQLCHFIWIWQIDHSKKSIYQSNRDISCTIVWFRIDPFLSPNSNEIIVQNILVKTYLTE